MEVVLTGPQWTARPNNTDRLADGRMGCQPNGWEM